MKYETVFCIFAENISILISRRENSGKTDL